MKSFKATDTKTNKLKWGCYLLLDLIVLIWINKYSDWHYISKFIFTFPLVINTFFDYYYFKNSAHTITELNFGDNLISVFDRNNKRDEVKYSGLKYSIRKRKFDRHKTEIELKAKGKFRFKTFGRLHIKNWEDIFLIEQELEKQEIPRVEWSPITLWSKYWGFFIELFFVTTSGESFGGQLMDYQEKQIKEVTENPIEDKEN